MKYKYYILSTPDDFYMADAICRELEKTGESCYYNLRDSRKADKMPDSYDKIGGETSLISVVNEEFLSNHSLSSPFSFYSKKTTEDRVFALQNGSIKEIPTKWNDFVWLDATKGLNGDLISVVKGELSIESKRVSESKRASFPVNPQAGSDSIQISASIQGTDSENICIRVSKPSIIDLIKMEEGLPLTLQRAIRYINGDGVPQDNDRAYTLFKKAVSENPNDFKAQYYFGICSEMELGDGKSEDAAAAYKKAMEIGKEEADVIAATKRLAMVKYDAGDLNEARNLLSGVTSSDPVYVSYGLGLIDEAEEKYEDAIEHYSEAAELGYEPAQNALGCLYAEGKGVKADERKALQWFVMAANAGLTEALVNAGVRLVTYDDEEFFTCGVEMLQEAANRGHQTARIYMMEIEERQIAEQRRLELERQRQQHQRQEQSRNHRDDDDGNNGSSGGSAWGAFLNGLDLPGLVDYAKGRL